MENQKQKKSVGTVLLVILLLIVTIASLILATYAWAKYTTQTEGTATAQVAKWDVGVDFKHNDFQETYSHILAGKMAPGSSGSFDIYVDPKTTEVDFKYEISLDSITGTNGKAAPKHLHFYIIDPTSGDAFTIQQRNDSEIQVNTDLSSQPAQVQSYLSGEIKPVSGTQDNEKNKIKRTIYWQWPYEDPSNNTTDNQSIVGNELQGSESDKKQNGIPDYDDQDTLDGMNATNVTVKFSVKATQLDSKASNTDGADDIP